MVGPGVPGARARTTGSALCLVRGRDDTAMLTTCGRFPPATAGCGRAIQFSPGTQ